MRGRTKTLVENDVYKIQVRKHKKTNITKYILIDKRMNVLQTSYMRRRVGSHGIAEVDNGFSWRFNTRAELEHELSIAKLKGIF